METTLTLLLVLAPFVGFLSNIILGKKSSTDASGYLATFMVLVSFAVSTMFFFQIKNDGQPITVSLFEWITLGNLSIGMDFYLDQLSLLWLMFVTGIGTLIHLYSVSYMHDDENKHKYFAYLNLFIFFMMVLVLGKNLLVMFIGWEGVGLCSYLLIGFWYKNQAYNDAAKKAFIMNRIGDLGFLIGIFIIGYVFDTIDFVELKELFVSGKGFAHATLLGIAALALFIAATGKSAQLPLYTWLPDAMAGPTPVSALIHAATMVTAGIFMITRLDFLYEVAPQVSTVIAYVGGITAFFAATIATVQNDIKKVLAYSTVSQLGLMFLALGLGAYQVAVFHVITHAFFKACLFLGSGSVIHAMGGEQDIRNMGGLKSYMKTTHITFLIATLAISGVPPLAGFFSKDEILVAAFHENMFLWILAAVASILTAYYMFRLYFLTFHGSFRGTQHQKEHLHESPSLITIPLVILAILSAVGGLISLPGENSWLHSYLAPVLFKKVPVHHLDNSSLILMGLAIVGALIGIGIAYAKFMKKQEIPVSDEKMIGFTSFVYDKYKVDELYELVIVKPILAFSSFGKKYIEPGISNMLFGLVNVTNTLAVEGKKLQNGNIGFYLFAFVFGLCSILYYLFFTR
nr:NADH-quinone oxidoreductase subunit L [uncultured Flavobacterium sp.]